jgi:uncharacterized membrane protein
MLDKFFHYAFMCHRIPSRSFFYKGKQFPICARCTGLLVGYILFIPIIFFVTPNIVLVSFLLGPMIIDGTIQRFTRYESNNILRLVTGILGGIGIFMLIAYICYSGYNVGYHLGIRLRS